MSDQPTAADLPDGTVIAYADIQVFIKNHPTDWSQWRGTSGGYFCNETIDTFLAKGAKVLRVGHPEGTER